jgi:hypothetical protein
MLARLMLAAAALVLAPAAAVAQPPQASKFEIVGNHAGRMLKLTVDGKVIFEGRRHLEPPGMTWIVDVPPGLEPAPLELAIEPCEQPFRAVVPRDGKTWALVIQACDIKLTQ